MSSMKRWSRLGLTDSVAHALSPPVMDLEDPEKKNIYTYVYMPFHLV